MTDQRKTPKLIPPYGGYRNLRSYQIAKIGGGVFLESLKEIGRGLGELKSLKSG